jgi:PAS domain S-box-containing protein
MGDTTKSVEAAALAENESELRKLTDLLPVCIFRGNLAGELTYTNERWREIMGLDGEASLGDGWIKAVHPDDRDRVVADWRNVVDNDGVADKYETESRIIQPHGTQKNVVMQVACEYSDSGELLGYIGSVTDITEQKRAENALAESEERFSLALSGANEGLWDWDLKTGTVYHSPRWFEMLGYEDGQLSGTNDAWAGLLHPDDFPQIEEFRAQCVEGETDSYDLEVHLRHKDGHFVDILSHVIVVRDDSGAPVRMVGTTSDISARKRAETALLESEERYRALTENTSDFVVIIEESGKHIYVSPSAEIVPGMPREQLMEMSIYDFVIPEDHKILSNAIDLAVQNPGKSEFLPEIRVAPLDSPVSFREVLVTSMLHVPSVRGIVTTSRDITQRKLMEKEAEESRIRVTKLRQRLDDAIDSLTDGFILFDADDRLVLCNSAYRNEFKTVGEYLTPGTLFEDFLRAIVSSDDIVPKEFQAEEKIQERMEIHKNPELGPWYAQMANGSWVMVNEYKTQDGGTALIRTDVTDRVKLEQDMAKAQKQAETANRAKSDFLSSMSHELRTPMNAILGFAQLLGQVAAEPLTENQKIFVDEILRSGHHMLDLIGDVLDLAKIESSNFSLDLENEDPGPMIDACLKMIGGSAAQNGISVRGQLPAGDLPLVRIDALRFKQALLNLLSNAVKYNRPNGKVTLECSSDTNRKLHISVSDTGPGIPRNMRDKVFEPFDRLGAESSDITGTGIGLSVSKQLIEGMGGSIGFKSAVGEGTTFWIEVPLASSEANTAL